LALALPPPTGIGKLSRETPVAFARSSVRGVETAITFARSYARGVETDIAFAGEKKLYFVHFSVAVVSAVSTVAVQGRAVVPAVSCWPASVAAEVLLVSKLARGRVLCAKKFAQRTKNDPKLAFCGVQGELFRENTAGGVVPGEVYRG